MLRKLITNELINTSNNLNCVKNEKINNYQSSINDKTTLVLKSNNLKNTPLFQLNSGLSIREHNNTTTTHGHTGETMFIQSEIPTNSTPSSSFSEKTTIFPLSQRIINEKKNMLESNECNYISTKIEHAMEIFDPDNSSPASEFINILKLRLSVYYDKDVSLFT